MSEKDIIKEYGDVILDASHITCNPPAVISVSPRIDIALGGGVPEGSLFILTGDPKVGKDQPLYSTVYTPDGPKKMEEMRVGERVVRPLGGTATVVALFPQGYRDVYRVYFDDGVHTDCGLHHLWWLTNDDGETVVCELNEIIQKDMIGSWYINGSTIPKNLKIPVRRYITKIEYIGKTHTQCIALDSEDGLYYTDFHIITHNTVHALHFAKNAQKTLVDGKERKVYYGNVEGRLKKRDLEGIRGLNYESENFKIIGSTKGNILSGEKYLGVFDRIIHHEPHALCIIDSFSALAAENELVGDITDIQVAAMNRYLSKFTRKFANVLPINKVTLVGITHLMANIQKFGRGKAKIEKSGNALKYAQDVKLHATHTTPLKQGDTQIGQLVHWVVENSAIGPPGQKVTSCIKYGVGIWEEYELAELAVDFGVANKKGAWITLPSGERCHGMPNFAVYLENNPNAFSDLRSEVMETLGLEC